MFAIGKSTTIFSVVVFLPIWTIAKVNGALGWVIWRREGAT